MIKGLGMFLIVLYALFSFQLEGFAPGISLVILLVLALASGLGAVFLLVIPGEFQSEWMSNLRSPTTQTPEELIRELEALARMVRQEGLLALESRRKELRDPFLRHLMKKVMDGHEKSWILPLVRSQCDLRLQWIDRIELAFDRCLQLVPMIGLFPTLVMLAFHLARPSQAGLGMAFAPFGLCLLLQILLEAGLGSLFDEWKAVTRVHYGLLEEGVSAIQDGITVEILSDRLKARTQITPRWADA
jgi:flagellar motor component MotA